MLKDNLLLDSASSFSNDRNNSFGCPEHSSVGVPFSCLDSDKESETYRWYLLRVSYSRELKIKAILDEKGIQTFVPMMWRKKIVAGKEESRLVPAVGNLCFVRWSKDKIDDFMKGYGENSPVHYYWDRTTRAPMVIPDKAMTDFIAVASSMDKDLIYLTQISDKLHEGQTVRVKSGSFAGVEGKIVRIRKTRRVMVELPGMLAVVSAYINPEELEII